MSSQLQKDSFLTPIKTVFHYQSNEITEFNKCYLSFFFFSTFDIFGDWQDISQPNFEANPPDGVLAVPLLRYQVTLQLMLCYFMMKNSITTPLPPPAAARDPRAVPGRRRPAGPGTAALGRARLLPRRPIAATGVGPQDRAAPTYSEVI